MGRLFSFTYPTAAVLLAIVHGHRYGFDIMDATGLPDGTVYPILRRLERRHRWTRSEPFVRSEDAAEEGEAGSLSSAQRLGRHLVAFGPPGRLARRPGADQDEYALCERHTRLCQSERP
jgi:hypothetical protein